MESFVNQRCKCLNKQTTSLSFGILISIISSASLVISMCFQTWAVRQEIVLLKSTREVQDSIKMSDIQRAPNVSVHQDIQINVPIEVPSLMAQTFMPYQVYNATMKDYELQWKTNTAENSGFYGRNKRSPSNNNEVDVDGKQFVSKKRVMYHNTKTVNNLKLVTESSKFDKEVQYNMRKYKFRKKLRIKANLGVKIRNMHELKNMTQLTVVPSQKDSKNDVKYNSGIESDIESQTRTKYEFKTRMPKFQSTTEQIFQLASKTRSNNPLRVTEQRHWNFTTLTSDSSAIPRARYAENRLRKRSPVLPRRPVLVRLSICLWRVCVEENKDTTRSNAGAECFSVLSDLETSKPSRYPSLSPSTTTLLSTLRCSSCVIGGGLLMLLLAVTFALMAALYRPTRVTGHDKTTHIFSKKIRHLSQQQYLAFAAALFAFAGITIGGGMFQFCSAVTERPVIPSLHSLHYHRAANLQPSASLHWPVLMAANSIVGCFLAALATGYTFFISWDKHITRKFITTSEISDRELQETYDDIHSCKRTVLCGQCQTSNQNGNIPSSHIPQVVKQCIQNSYVPSTTTETNCSIIPFQPSKTCSAVIQTHKINEFDYRSKCVQCMNDHKQICQRKSSALNSDVNSICSTDNYSSPKFVIPSTHKTIQDFKEPNMISYDGTNAIYPPNHNNKRIFDQQISRNSKRYVMKTVCDDPICQREQLQIVNHPHSMDEFISTKTESFPLDDRSFNTGLTSKTRTPQITYLPGKSYSRLIPPIKDVASLPEEHFYSNFTNQNISHVSSLTKYEPQRNHRVRGNNKQFRSGSLHDDCAYCNECRSYTREIHHLHKPHTMPYEPTQPWTITQTHTNFGDETNMQSNFGRYSGYSTLPAKFSKKNSLKDSERERRFSSNRYYNSCANLNENINVVPPNYFTNSLSLHSSTPSLRKNISEFGSRKSVKSVKFALEDDESESSENFSGIDK